MKRHRNATSLLPASLVLLMLASCATGPRTRPPEGEAGEFAPLAPGALAYISVDVKRARPILDLIYPAWFSGKEAEKILDKTDSASVAVYPFPDPRSFLIAARGGPYPGFRAALSFALSPAWKRIRSPEGGFYWRSDRQGLSVALDKRRAFVSAGDPLVRPPGTTAPPSYGPFRREALLAGWTDYGGASMNRFLANLEIPLRFPADRIVFAVYDSPAGGEYQAVLRIETPSLSHAKALAAIFSLTRSLLAELPPEAREGPLTLAAALFANTPVQDGPALIAHTGPLDAAGIALLFAMLSLY